MREPKGIPPRPLCRKTAEATTHAASSYLPVMACDTYAEGMSVKSQHSISLTVCSLLSCHIKTCFMSKTLV